MSLPSRKCHIFYMLLIELTYRWFCLEDREINSSCAIEVACYALFTGREQQARPLHGRSFTLTVDHRQSVDRVSSSVPFFVLDDRRGPYLLFMLHSLRFTSSSSIVTRVSWVISVVSCRLYMYLILPLSRIARCKCHDAFLIFQDVVSQCTHKCIHVRWDKIQGRVKGGREGEVTSYYDFLWRSLFYGRSPLTNRVA